MKIVSACLAGIKCRYDGGDKANEKVIELVREGEAIPLCPEQLAGMTTPRPACELREGKVYTNEGIDLTSSVLKGAEEAFRTAKEFGCTEAILKAKSPTCGCGKIYDGTFSGKLIEGDGIFAGLLKKNGIKVLTEEDL